MENKYDHILESSLYGAGGVNTACTYPCIFFECLNENTIVYSDLNLKDLRIDSYLKIKDISRDRNPDERKSDRALI